MGGPEKGKGPNGPQPDKMDPGYDDDEVRGQQKQISKYRVPSQGEDEKALSSASQKRHEELELKRQQHAQIHEDTKDLLPGYHQSQTFGLESDSLDGDDASPDPSADMFESSGSEGFSISTLLFVVVVIGFLLVFRRQALLLVFPKDGKMERRRGRYARVPADL